MKPKLCASLLIGLFLLSLLTGCMRNRLINPALQPSVNATNPAAPTQAALLPTNTPTMPQGVTPTQPPVLTTATAQPQPTATVQAVQPTPTVSSAAATEISKAADELSNELDDLTKDLNSADNLNDVK